MATIFFGHGSPMNAIEENFYTRTWVQITKHLTKPRAILSISAHWETEGTKITSNTKQRTIHDFGGFPKELYEVQYTPNGSQELVKRIQELCPDVILDGSWGLDHGTWSILKHTHPNHDIPVIQLSIDRNKTQQEHYDFAKKLSPLRYEDILIIGTGNIVHNLREIDWSSSNPYPWAIKFSTAIKKAILTNDFSSIINYHNLDGAAESVPTMEHFVPLLYILALQKDKEKIRLFNERIEMKSIDMTGVIIG